MIFPCSICSEDVISDAIECTTCSLWVHRKCSKLTKNQLRSLGSCDKDWHCQNCEEIFPYYNISDEEFVFINSRIDLGENLFDLYKETSDLNFKPFSYTEYLTSDFQQDIDPVNNFYNSISVDCQYLTDSQIENYTTGSGLSIIHFNCRSLSANFHKLENYLCSLTYTFDIIAISETWLDSKSSDNFFKLDGYEMCHIDRTNKRGGGVALYIKSQLKYSLNEKLSTTVQDLFECITVEIALPKKTITVSCVYRQPGSDIDVFIDNIEKLYLHKKSDTYICGDFNINLLNHESHNGTRNFLNLLFSLGFYPLIDKPTRITNSTASLIDNIFTNVLNVKSYSGLIINDISDHLPVFCICSYDIVCIKEPKYIYIRRKDEKAIENFKCRLSTETWNDVYSPDDVNTSYDNFISKFTIMYNDCFPVKKICINNSTKKDKPWITKGLKNACKKKRNLYKNFLKYRTLVAERKYKIYKNKLTSVFRYCEKEYYSSLLQKCQSNIKETWKILNEVIKRKHQSPNYPDTFINDTKQITDQKQIANGFNNFFVNVGPNLAAKIPNNCGSVSKYLGDKNMNSMFLTNVSELDILNTVRDLSNKNSTDCNGISMSLVKFIINDISEPLLFICNQSFSTGVFPNNMKTAKVIPLYKTGEKNLFTNYRPISLLPQFSKILEKLFDIKLTNFVTKHDILTESQYGFRTGRSTTMALLELLEEVTMSLDSKKSTIGVFIDLKKAFDTIDHSLLLKKLEHYGIRGLVLDWLTSYLNHRKQYVQLNNITSDLYDVICGVPQGSILGPKLFILYINDICNVSKLFKFVIFADDTNIFSSHENIHTLSRLVSTELDKLHVWFSINKLSLNVSKTNYMVFTNRKVNHINVTIAGTVIDRVYVTKFLGVLIDCKITWKDHITSIASKLSKSIAIIYRASLILNDSAIYTLYCTLFLPYLNYCSVVWGNTYKTTIMPLVLKQKRIVRIICRAKFLEHTDELFRNLKVMKLSQLIDLNTSVFMFKAFHEQLPQNLQNYFVRTRNHDYDMKNKKNFYQKFVRTRKKQLCISISGVKLWNSLSDCLKSSRNIHCFKRLYKKMLWST